MSLKRIIISGAWLSVGVLLGRLAGFFREMAIANTFGVSATADVVIFALTIPNFLVNLLIAGGLSAALIPEFKRYNQKEAGALFLQSSLFSGLMFALVAFVLVFFSDEIVMVFAPGFDSITTEKASELLKVVLWLIPLTVLAGVATAYLQSMERFAMPAMGTLIFNLCVLLGLLFVNSADDLSLFVWFVIFGGGVRWFSQLWVLRGNVFLSEFNRGLLLSREIFRRYYQAVIAIGILTFFPVAVRTFSTMEGEGGLAMANYALRLIEFPLGIVITVLSVVLFPRLASFYEDNDRSGFASTVNEGVLWSVVLALSISGAMFTAADSYVALAFDWGGVTNEHLSQISLFMAIGVISLPLQALISMLSAAFYAQKDTKSPMYVSLVGFVFLLMFCWVGEALWGLKGIFYALVMSYFFVTASLVYMLGRRKENDFFDTNGLLRVLFWPILFVCFVSTVGAYLSRLFDVGDFFLVIVSLFFALVSVLGVALMSARYRNMMLVWFK